MKNQNLNKDEIVQEILALFFNQENHEYVKKGEILLNTGGENERLYYVRNGALEGIIEEQYHENFKVFHKKAGDFIGLHSFFNEGVMSYITIKATEDSELMWVSKAELILQEKYNHLCGKIITIISEELWNRSIVARKFSEEKQELTKKALINDSLSTLGELSSALAHEINNAVGVIHQKADWFQKTFVEILNKNYGKDVMAFFDKGLRVGKILDTAHIRSTTKDIYNKYSKITNTLAKHIAKTGLKKDDLPEKITPEVIKDLELKYLFWTCGVTLRNMETASVHASHVVNSVKSLGRVHTAELESISVEETVKKAIALLPNNIHKNVTFALTLESMPNIMASEGDLIQVWLNLIKNGCEAMVNSHVSNPKITVTGRHTLKNIHVKIFNTGPKIPDDIQKTMFQANVTTKRSGLSFGLGLGLSIVHKILLKLDGDISFESNDKQTMFRVKIPHLDYRNNKK